MSSAPPPPPPPAGPPPAGPPPDQGGATPPPSATPEWELGAAIGYGWNKYVANVAQIMLAALVLVVGVIVLAVLGGLVVGALTSTATCGYNSAGIWTCDDGTPFLVTMFLNALVGAVIFLYAQIVGAGLIRGALGITEGRDFQVAEVFKIDKIGPVIVTSLIVAAAAFVGYLLCFVPGLIVAFVTSYSLFFVIDKDLPPVEAIKASFELVKDNLGPTIVWYLVGALIAGAGALVCGVGMLLTVPIVLIGSAWTYKVLTRQPVAP